MQCRVDTPYLVGRKAKIILWHKRLKQWHNCLSKTECKTVLTVKRQTVNRDFWLSRLDLIAKQAKKSAPSLLDLGMKCHSAAKAAARV